MFGKVPRKAARIATLVLASSAILAASSGVASASAEVVYNYMYSPLPGNVDSIGFEATQTSEFGGQIELEGAAGKKNPTVSFVLSSWACQTGTWNGGNCGTKMGAKFAWPVTVKINEVGPGNSVGPVLATASKTYKIPYRPSANYSKCTEGRFYRNGCFNGLAVKEKLALHVASLPTKIIVTIAYNTSDYGAMPQGDSTACHSTAQGCPYDSLNVGLNDGEEEPTRQPTRGHLPDPDEAYVNGSPESGWTGYQPLFAVSAH